MMPGPGGGTCERGKGRSVETPSEVRDRKTVSVLILVKSRLLKLIFINNPFKYFESYF